MFMIDRLHYVLTPRLAGVINLMLVAYGVFGPPLAGVITEQLVPTLTPLAVLLTVLGLSVLGKRLWQTMTGHTGYIPTGTTADYRHSSFLLSDGLAVATRLCAWMTLGSLFLFVVALIEQ
jgi:hypothetical protein